jgi:hypothetical protein
LSWSVKFNKVNGSPPTQYAEAKNPPLEIRDTPKIAQYADGCGFLSFVIFASHINKPEKFDKVKGLCLWLLWFHRGC